MDYKRVHLLLDKYWRCLTTVEEERELRRFFSEETIPPPLQPYKHWFLIPEAEELPSLNADFDRKILEQIAHMKKVRHHRFLFVSILLTLLSLLLLILLFSTFFIWGNDYL